ENPTKGLSTMHAPLKATGRDTQPRLKRETFKTSRLLDFCSERELTKQIGHGTDRWPLVILKELTDNAMDAAEEAGIAPVIEVEVNNGAIVITDNGPGIAAETVVGILDFSVRVSSREASPSDRNGLPIVGDQFTPVMMPAPTAARWADDHVIDLLDV